MSTIDIAVNNALDDSHVSSVTTEGVGGVFLNAEHFISVGNATGTDKRCMMVMFRGVTIPAGATITAAHISFRSFGTAGGTVCRARIWGDDDPDGDPDDPTTAATFWARVKTTAYVDWQIPAWTADTWYDTPDLATIIQELLNSYTLTNNDMQFIIWNNGSDLAARRNAQSYDEGAASAPVLHIEYVLTPTITSLTENHGTPGDSVVVAGTKFGAAQGAGGVTMNGVAATVTAWADTSITVTVPVGATTGPVIVTNGTGGVSAGSTWTLDAAPAVTTSPQSVNLCGGPVTAGAIVCNPPVQG